MNYRKIRVFLLLFLFSFSFDNVSAAESAESDFNVASFIMHHIADAHDWHIADFNGHPLSIPLPVILYTHSGVKIFSSSKFHHDDLGKVLVEVGEESFVKFHEKIYYAAAYSNETGSYLELDEEHHALNEKPYDFSITRNVASMFMSIALLWILFGSMAKKYNKDGLSKGIGTFLEPLVLFVRDDIAVPNIGEAKAEKFTPYLLTAFFFILINNLIGLIPFFPGGSNLTGNIAFTFVLAFATMLFTNLYGSKAYWSHIFMPPGVPFWLYPIMVPVELAGIISKPFALMMRLFANITAGHILIISLISLIFMFKSVAIAPISLAFVLFMNCIELLVAFLQAYIFTLLSALFIGLAVAEPEHH